MMESENKLTKVEVSQIFSEQETTFDFYSCEQAIHRLNDYLDHELDPAEREDVIKHLHICKPCLERFHFEETLIVQLRTRMANLCCPNKLKERLSSAIKNLTH